MKKLIFFGSILLLFGFNTKDINGSNAIGNKSCYLIVKNQGNYNPDEMNADLIADFSIPIISSYFRKVESIPVTGVGEKECQVTLSLLETKKGVSIAVSGENIYFMGDSELNGLRGLKQSLLKPVYQMNPNRRDEVCKLYGAIIWEECGWKSPEQLKMENNIDIVSLTNRLEDIERLLIVKEKKVSSDQLLVRKLRAEKETARRLRQQISQLQNPEITIEQQNIIIIEQTLSAIELFESQQQTRVFPGNGDSWVSLNASEKMHLIRGIELSREFRHNSLLYIGKFDHFGLGDKDFYEFPSYINVDDIIKYYNRLYSDFSNRNIRWIDAFQLAATFFRNDDSNDHGYLLEFFRMGKTIPKTGRIEKILSADTLLITDIKKNDRFKLKLFGIDTESLTNYQWNRIFYFLLSISRQGDGSKSIVNLKFPVDFFDANGILNGVITMLPSSTFLINKREVKLKYLPYVSDYQFLDINSFLIMVGLVYPIAHFDKKWGILIDDRKPIMSPYDESDLKFYSSLAKKSELYLYGSRALVVVEEFIENGRSKNIQEKKTLSIE